MPSKKISISDILSIKGGNVEELCLYAKNKGLNIPCDPNYVLSPSELMSIDPLLAYNIRYGKLAQAMKEFPNNKSDNEDEKCNEVNLINKKQQKEQKTKRVIGIVKFFDSYKGWGFAISGSKDISGKLEEGKLFSLHFTSSQWNGVSSPIDKEWILLTPRKTQRGWSALNVERLEYNRDTLLFAMKYRGKYAKIYGSDKKGGSFDENILCHIIEKMTI